jgi:hypothetical protein
LSFGVKGSSMARGLEPVAEVPGETWKAISAALRSGGRGLPGGDSLARLLRRRGRIGERRGRPPQVARHFLVRRLRAEGLSLAEIGRRLGISRQAAWEMLKRVSENAEGVTAVTQ